MKTIALTTIILAGSGWGLTTLWSQSPTIDRTVPAALEGIVVVRVADGDVRIEAWDRNEVHVTGTIGSDPDRLEIVARNGYVDIRVVPPLHGSLAAHLTIRVPAGSSLDVETQGAAVTVEEVEGMVRLASIDGPLTIAGVPLGFVARSERGDIDLSADGVPGLAHSVEGTVTLRGRPAGQTADSFRCDRPGECYRFGQTRMGSRDLGQQIGDLVANAVRGVDVSGFFDVEPRRHGFDMQMSADVNIDTEAMERFFGDLELVMADVEIQVNEGMAILAEEMERLGEELQRAGERYHRHERHRGRR